MSPRPLESQSEFLARLRRAAACGQTEVRFGQHHVSHAACLENGAWRVRKLEATEAECAAFLAEHGHFMPENLEDISTPRTLVFEAPSLDELVTLFGKRPWPL